MVLSVKSLEDRFLTLPFAWIYYSFLLAYSSVSYLGYSILGPWGSGFDSDPVTWLDYEF